jgi:hypothetical protein
MDLATTVYIQYTTFGFSPQVLPTVPLQVLQALWALLGTLFSCFLHVGALYKVLDLTGQLGCSIEEGWFLSPLMPLFLVKGIITVY